jgi:hypothetical protein
MPALKPHTGDPAVSFSSLSLKVPFTLSIAGNLEGSSFETLAVSLTPETPACAGHHDHSSRP